MLDHSADRIVDTILARLMGWLDSLIRPVLLDAVGAALHCSQAPTTSTASDEERYIEQRATAQLARYRAALQSNHEHGQSRAKRQKKVS